VAKLLGHEVLNYGIKYKGDMLPTCRGTKSVLDMLPDYDSDLNACAEFEKVLGSRNAEFALNLSKVTPDSIIFATAHQRTTAFLITMLPEQRSN